MIETIAKGPISTIMESTNLVEVHESYMVVILAILLVAVTVMAVAIELVRRNHAQELRHIAYHDPVTGLWNHAYLLKECNDLLKRGSSKRYAIISADVDSFKSINNIFGIGYGNELLKNIGAKLQEALPSALVVRESADVFLILTPYTTDHRLHSDVESVVDVMGRVSYKDATEFTVSVSAGVYVIGRSDLDAAAAINKANMARFAIKRNGDKCINYFTEEMRATLADEAILENDLKQALERDEFSLVYQPKVGLNNGIVGGFEALIRWNHPVVGVIGPSRFIPIAERTGVMNQISAWLVEQACLDIQKFNAQWLDLCGSDCEMAELIKDESLTPVVISINLSPNDLVNPTLIMNIQSKLEEHHIHAGLLEIEITESAFFTNQEVAVETINKLRDLGFSVALDDFGTGYSALGHLVRLPLQVVKLDRVFIQEIETDPRSRQMVFSIINLVQSLGYSVVAEGAETQAHIDVLRQAGCDAVQGFFYSQPLITEQMFDYYTASLQSYLDRGRTADFDALETAKRLASYQATKSQN